MEYSHLTRIKMIYQSANNFRAKKLRIAHKAILKL